MGVTLRVGVGNDVVDAAAGWVRRAAASTRRYCRARDVAWNVTVPSALSVQLGTPRRRGGGGWFKIRRGRRSLASSAAASTAASIDVPADAAAKPRMARLEALGGGAGIVLAACGSTVFVASLDEIIEAGSTSAQKALKSASRSVGSATRSVQKKLESAFADKEEEGERGRAGEKSSKEENEDVYYDGEEPQFPPNGSYEDLDGFTHFIADQDEFPVLPAELEHAREASPPPPPRGAWAPSPSPQPEHRRPPAPASASSPFPPRKAPHEPPSQSSLSPLPPRLREYLPLFRPAPSRDFRWREPFAVATKHASSSPRKGGVSLRQVRLGNYEESLAARVRTIQRTFPDVATEIANAVYAYARQMKHLPAVRGGMERGDWGEGKGEIMGE